MGTKNNTISQKEVNTMVKRYGTMQSNRSNYNNLCEEIVEYILPYKDNILSKKPQGDFSMERIYDTTGMDVLKLFASSMHSLLTNPVSKFFDVKLQNNKLNSIKAVRVWLQDYVETLLTEIRDSNWDSQAYQMFLDIGAVAQGNIFIGENQNNDGLHFEEVYIAEAYTAQNDYGIIDTVYRKFPMSAKQAVEKFGRKSVSKEIKDLYDSIDQQDTQKDFLHITAPRQIRDDTKKDKYNKPFMSLYVEYEVAKVVYEGGYEEFPWITPRWSVLSGEETGRGPAMDALPDIRMINRMANSVIRNAELANDPVKFFPHEGIIGSPIMSPGGFNYYDPLRPDFKVETLPVGDTRIGLEMLQRIEQRIKEAFYADQLQFQRDANLTPMTATEALQRRAFQRQVLAPILGRLNSELLTPLVTRISGILDRMGKLPEPPEEIIGERLIPKFTSQLAQAQRTEDAQLLATSLQSTLPLLQFFPEGKDNFNADVIIRTTNELLGAPAEILRDEKEVLMIRQQRQEQQQQQMQRQQMMENLQGAEQAGKAGQAVNASKQMEEGGE